MASVPVRYQGEILFLGKRRFFLQAWCLRESCLSVVSAITTMTCFGSRLRPGRRKQRLATQLLLP